LAFLNANDTHTEIIEQCFCKGAEAGATKMVATMELEAVEQQSETFVEVADQIVRQDSGRLSAVELLRATLTNTACSSWAASGENFPSAAEIFDTFAYWRSGGLREQLERCFEVVGRPGSVLQRELRRSDVLVRRGDGDMGHIAIITSPQLKSLETILTEGLIPETFSVGLYAQVIETGAWPHELADQFARLITEPNGRIPRWQLILRPKLSSPMRQRPQTVPSAGNGGGRTPEAEQILQAAAGMDAEGIGRLVDDLLLLRLATPSPTVVTVTPPASAVPAPPEPATTGADASEAAFAEVEVRNSPEYIRWIQTSLNQIDSAALGVDGIQGPLTSAAIRNFQTRHALDIDGIVGPETEAELIAEGAPRPPGYSLCAVASLGTVDPTNLNVSPVGEKDYAAGTFTAASGRALHIRGNVVYPATVNGSGMFNPNLGGPAPIIFMAHGNHATATDPAHRTVESCGDPGHQPIPNHRGYIYFQELLAHMGIISVSVDCNETNCQGQTSTNLHERADLIVASIRHFQSLNSGADPIFRGRIDFSRVGLFGHSRGAEAILVVPELTGSRAPAAATIVGAISVAPTDTTGSFSGAPRCYTFMTILPAADGDVRFNSGAEYYDQATPSPFKTQLYVHEANHNFFNREWVNPDKHSGAGPLTRPEHERLLNVYGSAFFREVFFAHGFRNLLLGKEIPPSARTGKVHVSAEVNNPPATVDDYENNNVALNKLGQTVTLTGFSTAKDFPFSQTAGAFNSSFFGNTNGLVLLRSSATNRLRSPLNAATDLAGKEVWIRAAEVYTGSIPRGRTGFRIGLEDSSGRIAFVDSNVAGTLPRPFDRRSDDLVHFGIDFTKTMLETFRFPAGCFAGGSGFNIKAIKAIHLQLNRSDGRPLAFDQLQIV
jgi:peptidoglycan hydrolase-like protein with peptidoglycan-binding domain